MQTAERSRLVSTHSHPAAHPVALVLKCGVALALLTLLAVIGANVQGTAGHEARNVPNHAAPAANLSRTDAYRKEVFDARRAALADNGPAGPPAAPAPTARVDAAVP